MTLDGTWTIQDLTAGEGPITVGFAFDDYSVTEVKECLEIGASINLGDKIAQEKANRLVRIVGTFVNSDPLQNGMRIKTRLNWAVPNGHSFIIFAYNESGSALSTGAFVNFQGDLWVKDGA